MSNQRNLILAVVLSALLLLGWNFAMEYFYPQPAAPAAAGKVDTPSEQAAAAQPSRGLGDPGQIAAAKADLATALASTDRIRIDAPRMAGSIKLTGAVIDDIVLKDHRETVKKDSGPVRFFAPAGTPAQQFAEFGFLVDGVRLPENTLWTADGEVLTPETPVTLTHRDDAGRVYAIRFSVDDDYMITAEQSVANTGANSVVVQPFGLVNRTSRTASADQMFVHSGPIGAFDGSVKFGPDYGDLDEENIISGEGRTGWVGFTDIYWMSALVPQDGATPDSSFRALGNETYRADMIYDPVTVPAGRKLTTSSRLFAGAKESVVLDQYQDAGVANLGLAVDWGWFRWFEKPILWLLRQLDDFVGNFGLAIILLTIIVRALMFPIAQKQFASMAAMKAIQPKMKALQERFKDDKQKQQQEIMALYKKEKVNPLAGCLPILIQIPIFYALYKVLILAIEMRHEPFILWVKDLSAPDPATILNLFGLLPFTPPGFLAIGVLAVLLGVTMWLTFKLNPAAMDPIQQQMFAIMPWVLMFVMAPFAAGLLLYWVTSNVLTLAQQKYLYSRHPQLRAAAEQDKAKPAEGKT